MAADQVLYSFTRTLKILLGVSPTDDPLFSAGTFGELYGVACIETKQGGAYIHAYCTYIGMKGVGGTVRTMKSQIKLKLKLNLNILTGCPFSPLAGLPGDPVITYTANLFTQTTTNSQM